MRIACLVKFAVDVENYRYDNGRNTLVRENSRMVLNPDDACALAYALKQKERRGGGSVTVDAVSLAPKSALKLARDILRVNVDRFILLSDEVFAGSDTFVTSMIIARYLGSQDYDLILSGTRSLDGDTAHVPSQVAEILHLGQISNIVGIEELNAIEKNAVVRVGHDDAESTYKLKIPAVLSVSSQSGYKLPFVRFADLESYVDDRITMLSNEELALPLGSVGLKGSLTAVKGTMAACTGNRSPVFVKTDEEGIDAVYRYLKEKGLIHKIG